MHDVFCYFQVHSFVLLSESIEENPVLGRAEEFWALATSERDYSQYPLDQSISSAGIARSTMHTTNRKQSVSSLPHGCSRPYELLQI